MESESESSPRSGSPLSEEEIELTKEGKLSKTTELMVVAEKMKLITTGSQTAQQVHEDLIKEMECPVCYKYMVSQIVECSNGHCICSSCKRNINTCPQCKIGLTDKRNRLAESISNKLLFPCTNADVGCPEIVFGEALMEHQIQCPRRVYKCLLDTCQWTGRNENLLDHFKVEHNANLLLGPENTITWRNASFDAKKKMYYLIVVKELLFFHTQQVTDNLSVLVYCTQFIGPKAKAADYHYKLELTTKDQSRHATLTEAVLDDTKTVNTIFESGGGLRLTIPYVKGFLDGDKSLVQKLSVVYKNQVQI